MRTFVLTLFVMLTAPLFAQQNVPALQFESAPDFFKLPPELNFGEVSGVAVDSKGNVYVFSRSNSANGPAYAPTAALPSEHEVYTAETSNWRVQKLAIQ